MKTIRAFAIAAIAAAFASTSAFGADENDTKTEKKRPSLGDRFDKLDANSDKKLSESELKGLFKKQTDEKATQQAKTVIKRKDKDGNGTLSKEEFTSAKKKKKEDGTDAEKEGTEKKAGAK